MEENNHTTIQPLSNITVRKLYDNDPNKFIPVDLLPKSYSDVRSFASLSKSQQEQIEKRLFYAKKVVFEDGEEIILCK